MNRRNTALEGPLNMTTTEAFPSADSHPVNGHKKPDFRKLISEVGDGLVTLLLAKNLDYGNNIAKPPCMAKKVDPQTAALVRMSDKVARIEQLAERGAAVPGETLDDSLLDLAGYCILLVAYRRSRTE